LFLISGEAGIGKSRVTAAVLEGILSEPHTRLRYFCSPQHTDSAFYPIIGQMERAAGFAHDDAAEAKLNKLDAVLARTSTSKQDAALFADMLSLPNDGRYPGLQLKPQQRRQRTLQALVSQMEALAGQNPVLMILEDAHWSDPTSLEAFGRVIDRIATLRVLLLVTFRPEFAAPWIGQPHVTAFTLNRLPKRDIDALIDGVVANKLLSASIRQDIIERTDGIPLFVEEMTKAVLEAESEAAARRTAAAIPAVALAVPASLQASLMARLDRLGPAKEIAQMGAAIGREFSHSLLAAVARKSASEFGPALDRLVDAGLLFRQGMPPHATYLFKHALIQDAAYGTLLREPRRALHARIAGTIETLFAETAENQPELLAHHCTEAALIEKATGYWGKAGQRSLARSALAEAVAQLTRALDQIATLPATPALRREEIKLQVALITPLMYVKGYSAAESKMAIERARLLIEQAEAFGESPEDPLILFEVLHGAALSSLMAFNAKSISDLVGQFLALAERQGHTMPLVVGHRLMGSVLHFAGDFTSARAQYERSLALYDAGEHRILAIRFGQDSRATSLYLQAAGLWILGYPALALVEMDRALREAREIGQASTLMPTLANAIVHFSLCGDYAVSGSLLDELFALAKEKEAAFWQAAAILLRGCLLAVTGKPADAVEIVSSGLPIVRATGARLLLPWMLSQWAYACAQVGKYKDAWGRIDEAVTLIETTGQRSHEAEILRIAGDIALLEATPDAGKAEAHFNRRPRCCSQAASKVLGTPRRNEHGAVLARPGQAGGGSRAACSGVWLVHRGVRHARPERGQDATR
jgi:predicted ATPase